MDKKMKIGILGAGVEGVETAKYLSQQGFTDLTVFDNNPAVTTELPAGVQKVFEIGALEKATTCNVVFRSPGIALKNLQHLIQNGVKITSATRYFLEHCPCPVVGVTGTKGKGTTSTLISLMLKEAGHDVYLGGNIGESPLKFLDRLNKDSIVILELSSFQLQDCDRSPQIAVMLGVTTDHLDYHSDQDEYREAKTALVKNQKTTDLVILNRDYESTAYYEKLTPAQKVYVSTRDSSGDGVHLSGPMIVNCTPPKAADGAAGSSVQSGGTCELICNSKKVALIGKHHLENVLPAVAVARHFNVAVPLIQKVLTTFKGLPHRLEEVADINDVKYYDDSISTTPETSVAAVNAFDKLVILLAGGSDKEADYTDWGLALQQAKNLKAIIVTGHTAEKMLKSLQSAEMTLNSRGLGRHYPLEIIHTVTFEEAVHHAQTKAAPGDVVVLSPAAASFDMFKNYKERGERFKELATRPLS